MRRNSTTALGRDGRNENRKMQSEEYQERKSGFYAPFLAEHGDDTAKVGYPGLTGQ